MTNLARLCAVVVSWASLVACSGVHNLPINRPSSTPLAAWTARGDDGLGSDDVMVGLAFSGGGTRAAAFSFGVLRELARTEVSGRGRDISLIDRVDIVTGVSGGSVTAAYFGLRRAEAIKDFRERFLIQDAEQALVTSFSFGNVARALGGGVNGDEGLRRWLDDNLFEGATFGTMLANRRPRVVINASDLFNRTPFVFSPETFAALCSDISTYPISAAVAASAAVPLAFAPVVLENFPEHCDTALPDWMTRALRDPRASPMMQAVARGMTRYRDGSMRYVKLVDGGVVDNFGLSSFTVAREASRTPYGPLTAERAAKLRRILFVVVDSGQPQQGDWTRTLEGPSGFELAAASTNAALEASVRASYSAFQANLRQWREAMVRWRCGLSMTEVLRLRGSAADWTCRDLDMGIAHIGFDQLDPARAAVLNAVPTRFRLPVDQVDALIAAGADALAQHPTYRDFLASLARPPGVGAPSLAGAGASTTPRGSVAPLVAPASVPVVVPASPVEAPTRR